MEAASYTGRKSKVLQSMEAAGEGFHRALNARENLVSCSNKRSINFLEQGRNTEKDYFDGN